MALIDTAEIKKQIAQHEKEIKILKELLDIASLLKSRSSLLSKEQRAKPERRGRKPKRKRGAVTDAIKTMLADSSKSLTSGEIKLNLESLKLVEKGASSVYSLLQSLVKRGVILKAGKGFLIKKEEPKAPARKKTSVKKTSAKKGAKKKRSNK